MSCGITKYIFISNDRFKYKSKEGALVAVEKDDDQEMTECSLSSRFSLLSSVLKYLEHRSNDKNEEEKNIQKTQIKWQNWRRTKYFLDTSQIQSWNTLNTDQMTKLKMRKIFPRYQSDSGGREGHKAARLLKIYFFGITSFSFSIWLVLLQIVQESLPSACLLPNVTGGKEK